MADNVSDLVLDGNAAAGCLQEKLLYFLAITFIHFLQDRHFDLTAPWHAQC
jgi:hypothetical protein